MPFFFNDTAATEIYTLSLHDALPISMEPTVTPFGVPAAPSSVGSRLGTRKSEMPRVPGGASGSLASTRWRSEEHTSELQSRQYLVCRLLLEKKTQKSESARDQRGDVA